MSQLYAMAEIFALLLGLCVGSFLNVCIARMPEDRSVVSPPSHVQPAVTRSAYDSIPIVSWVLLGPCRLRHSHLSSRDHRADGGTAVLVVLPPLRAHRHRPRSAHLAAFGMMATFVSMLVGLTFIDLGTTSSRTNSASTPCL